MRLPGHLPGPLRAAVGLAATAADEAKQLPNRAVELPMLAVSTVLQLSLRAQQRYAQLTARGDEVLQRPASDEPPEWATFDDEAGQTADETSVTTASPGDDVPGKDVSAPRHTAPSRFDTVGDE